MEGKHNKSVQISSVNVVEYRKVMSLQADQGQRRQLSSCLPKPCALTGDPDRVAWKGLILALKEECHEERGED